eukprot:NODE_613_length_1445_cov_356.151079.p1 GENE.NODE_613_length_1445_cov_356.151079~~NODE_613_length_1445_cov_356.151079.p1  ORF type:complete len:201 (+),score=76.48 NODE_613_length_1445_cov_356.151079:60-605(+)
MMTVTMMIVVMSVIIILIIIIILIDITTVPPPGTRPQEAAALSQPVEIGSAACAAVGGSRAQPLTSAVSPRMVTLETCCGVTANQPGHGRQSVLSSGNPQRITPWGNGERSLCCGERRELNERAAVITACLPVQEVLQLAIAGLPLLTAAASLSTSEVSNQAASAMFCQALGLKRLPHHHK